MSPKNQIPNRCTQLKRYKESKRIISHEHHPTFRRNLHMKKKKKKNIWNENTKHNCAIIVQKSV